MDGWNIFGVAEQINRDQFDHLKSCESQFSLPLSIGKVS